MNSYAASAWSCLFSEESNSPFHGYASNIETVNRIIDTFEAETTSKFCICRTTGKDFGRTEYAPDKNYKTQWNDNGIPYFIINKRIHDCQHGVDRDKNKKMKIKEKREKLHDYKKKQVRVQETKKFGCRAQIEVQEEIWFPDFKDAGILKPLDKSLISVINEQVAGGVTEVHDMQRHINAFVKTNFPSAMDNLNNRRYHPTAKSIADHMYLATQKLMHSKDDQKNLEAMISRWKTEKPDDKFYYRMKSDIQTFLFVVGAFKCEQETTVSIAEGLKVLADWNADWKPSFFMTDFDEKEINALEEVFEDCFVYLCDFHREQAWTRWVSKADNGVSNVKEEVLARIRRIARSLTLGEYKAALAALFSSTIWKTKTKFNHWFETYWLPHYKRWVWTFRQQSFQVLVRTNNGVERQNKSLKYEFLKKRKKSCLSHMANVLITNFFAKKYKKYVSLNVMFSSGYKSYSAWVPSYLLDRPRKFVLHCLEKLSLAARISSNHITVESNSDSFIKVHSDRSIYKVAFNHNGMPSCECHNWKENFLPCKHMFAVIIHCKEYSWESFPVEYRDSAYFTLDPNCSLRSSMVSEVEPTNGTEVLHIDNIEECHTVSEKEGYECSQSSHPGKLPLPASYSRSNGAACRDLLDQIKSLTFICQNDAVLPKLQSQLQDILCELRSSAQKEDNLVIENEKIPTKKQNKRRYCQIEKSESKLPVQPKRFKNSRVGSKADWNRQQRDCFLDINTGKIEKAAGRPKNRKQGKEQATTTQNVEETVVWDEISVSSSEDNSDDSSSSDRDGSNCKTGETNIAIDNDDVCIMDSSPEASQCGKSWLRIGNTILTAEDRDILDSKDMWLNDKLINAAQILLTKQFPHIGGFQDTLLQARFQFNIENGEFLQIVNKNNNHWILLTNIGLKISSHVRIMDSLGGTSLSFEMQGIVASLIHPLSPEVFVKFEDVEKQDDASSCGLFAIAFATMMCNGLDPRCFHLDIAKMRPHLKKCLTEGNVTLFPSKTKERSPNLGTLSSFRVHCSCRMPLDPDDVFDIQDCNLCSVSYHKSCVNLHKVTIKNIPGENKWICEECSNQCKVTGNIEISHTSGFHSKVKFIDDR
eukprot:gene17245-18965_t